jgi:Spy/CpxP family protein refolding chaperone
MKLNQMLAIAGLATLMVTSGTSVMAQGRSNFDPAQMRERMMTHIREQMDVKDDAEWKAIEGQVSKVMDARREVTANDMGGMRSMFRGSRGGSGSTSSTDTSSSSTSSTDQASSRRRGGGFFGEPSAEVTALQRAVEDKASSDEVQAKLSALRKANKDKEAKLAKAQADLKAILTPRQEAVAVLDGLLK